MLYAISFLAPHTRISSRQNADAISKGYQFMQQSTLSLKASLASEARALEGKSGEVLCYLLQLSPSAPLQCSHLRLPLAAGKGRFGSWEREIWQQPAPEHRDIHCLHAPAQPEHPPTLLAWFKAFVWGWARFTSQNQSTPGHYLQGKNKTKQKKNLKCSFPVPETVWSSCWWVMLSSCASVPWPTRASPLVPCKHPWGQRGIIAPLFHGKATNDSRKQLLVGWRPHSAALLLGR